ncbi:hypothetical protein [Cognatiluteimonas profundi]|uniref:hypothetical protein n=1 Tax=Cognatiluteimonas profundi TaxID=2594501 RepID=UPI00131C4477|nr:hypothetical protein [Lysobacter profundi]
MTDSVSQREALEAPLAEALASIERRQRENAKRKPKTDAQRKRDAVKARLRSCGKGIDDLAADLERAHGDKSGTWHYAMLPLFESRMRGAPYRPGLLDQFERIEREAKEGCELSAAFIETYGPLLRLCEHMRHLRPPPRAPDYDPLALLTPDQREWIKGAG